MINIFKKFKDGLKKTTSNFSKGIKEIIINKEIGDKELEKMEEQHVNYIRDKHEKI